MHIFINIQIKIFYKDLSRYDDINSLRTVEQPLNSSEHNV